MAGSEKQNNLATYALVALLVVGAYFLGVYKTRSDILSNGNFGTTGTGTQGAAATPEPVVELSDGDWKRVTESYAAALGDPNAPVKIVEFTDYQCPFCARHFTETYGKLKENYIDTGKVYYMIRDYPLSFHANAEDAAVAARCAGKSGKYLEMHDAMFENQTEWESLPDANEQLAKYASELGINIRSCQKDESVRQAVQADLALGSELGVSGTPAFFINGTLVVGAQPYATFEQEIESRL